MSPNWSARPTEQARALSLNMSPPRECGEDSELRGLSRERGKEKMESEQSSSGKIEKDDESEDEGKKTRLEKQESSSL